MMEFLLLLIVSFSFCWAQESNETRWVEVPGLGKVQGYYENGYTTFRGIEYGIIGKNYEEPIPYVPFIQDVYDADWKPECPVSTVILPQDIEQCLILKLDTKSFTERYPVIVFIPGYDLASGSARETSADFLMQKNVVVVTVQYRLDVYGFLRTYRTETSGNFGVQDIILALKWIKLYIQYFGGDPNRVTLLGHHQSAALVHFLTLTSYADGLFHQVIYHSGSLYMREVRLENDWRLIKYCSFIREISECLSSRHPLSLSQSFKELYNQSAGLTDVLLNEKELMGEQFRSYPTIVGFANNSVSKNSEFDFDEFFNETFVKYLDHLSNYGGSGNDKNFEIPTENLYQSLYNILAPAMNTVSKKNPIDPNDLGIFKLISRNFDKNFLFMFKYPIDTDFEDVPFDDDLSIYYVMKYVGHEYSEKDLKMVEIMVNFWTSFATTGVPVYEDIIEWPEVAQNYTPFLNLDLPMSFGTKIIVDKKKLQKNGLLPSYLGYVYYV